MKLRSIELTNLRRFAGQRASLTGIGDGITVLSEPNEFGKSTFFDALHALFFEKHRSTKAPVKSLQPHAGGAPEVMVEVELPEGRFRISKRWLGRAQAQVQDASGRLIAQADEAEAWIDRLMGGDLAGPSGLLWVRQGLLGIEPEGNSTDEKRERERGLAARRDLLSSVAGEIDMMTGGRRMDAVLDRVSDALGRLATATGRPKAGGVWAAAQEEAQRLAAEEQDLQPRAARLSGDLAKRTEVQRNLARLTNAEDMAARQAALQQAQAACQAAEAHQARIDQAASQLRLATLDAEAVARDMARLTALQSRVTQARDALARAETQAAAARLRAEDLAQRDQAASALAETAHQTTRSLRSQLARATQARAARAAEAQAIELRRRVERATTLQAALDGDRARRAQITVTAKALAKAEAAQTALDLLRARAAVQSVTIEAHPGSAPARIGDTPLPPGPQPILATTDLILPGFGQLRIDPGQGQGSDMAAAIGKAEQDLEKALVACGAESLIRARQGLAETQRLDAAIAQAEALLREVAPEGADALRQALALADQQARDLPEDAGDPEALTAALGQAEQAETEALAAAKAAHELAVGAGVTHAEAEGERRTAERRAAEALEEAGEATALAAQIATLGARAPALAAARAAAADHLASLQAEAPDLATLKAGLARAKGAVEQAAAEESRCREALASLNATISALAEEGIEERLAALAEIRAEAEARAGRYQGEVAALSRLKRALEEARVEARDAYFRPVLRELQPLLSILHPGAQLAIDDHSLLPATLTRNGQSEPLEILSGGTREQVAVLTRLAFARLFANAGRPVPLILDDALVHSDDDRIEAMFTALHRSAQSQQILVLTCRQRAFAALGGTRAEVRVEQT